MVTFFRLVKKVSRLPAGTGEVEFASFSFYLAQTFQATPAGRVPPDASLFIQAATKRKQKVPCHCVEHAVTQVRRSLTILVLSHGDSSFFERFLLRQLVAETLGPVLFPTVIEGAVGF